MYPALSPPPDCSLLCTSAMMACSAKWQPSSRYLQGNVSTAEQSADDAVWPTETCCGALIQC